MHLVDLDAPGFLATVVDHSGERLDVRVDWPKTDSVLVFSSGTTGLPKAVRHTHETMGAAVADWRSALGLTVDDSFQVTTPPFHVLGLLKSAHRRPRSALPCAFTRGSTSTPYSVYVVRDRIHSEMAVAPIASAMAQHPDLERFDLSSLRYIVWGATPITESVARECHRAHRCAVDARLRAKARCP